MSKRSQATGSQDEAPKVDKTMKGKAGSSKDIATRLINAADETPLPDDEEDEEAVSYSYSKDHGKVKVSPDQDEGQANDKDG